MDKTCLKSLNIVIKFMYWNIIYKLGKAVEKLWRKATGPSYYMMAASCIYILDLFIKGNKSFVLPVLFGGINEEKNFNLWWH